MMAERADRSTIFDGIYSSSVILHPAPQPATLYHNPWMRNCASAKPSLRHVVERHRSQPERQIRLEMQRRDHLAHRQPRDVGERVWEQAERGGAGPGLLQRDVLEIIAHQFA